jgi:hypothetical protein
VLKKAASARRHPALLAALAVVNVLAVISILLLFAAARPNTGTATTMPQMTIRAYKADLIERLAKPPRIVILGGSRATRFNPVSIFRKTGETAFNAAVTHARPDDEWALVSLLHQRFPRAHFRFLWVMHVDEFSGQGPSRDLVSDDLLSQCFPHKWVAYWCKRRGVAPEQYPLFVQPPGMTLAPDGYTEHNSLDVLASRLPLAQRVEQTIRRTMTAYRLYPTRLQPERRCYFQKTLRLMNSKGDKTVIVLAPLQPRFYADVYHHGWGLRLATIMNYLRALQNRYRFDLLNLSRASSVHAKAVGFYDGVHLRPATCRRVFDTVLSSFPRALR